MGNYASCVLARASKAVKVVFPEGQIRTIRKSVNAADLILEFPNYFVVNACSLEIGCCFSVLNADEELCIGNVYLLFPVERLNSVIGASDMGGLLISGDKKSKSKSKVVPFVEEEVVPGMVKLEDMLKELSTPQSGHRRSPFRSKKPVLETIVEEPTWVKS